MTLLSPTPGTPLIQESDPTSPHTRLSPAGVETTRTRDVGELGRMISRLYAVSKVSTESNNFRVQHRGSNAGSVYLSTMNGTNHLVEHTERMVTAATPNLVKLCFVLSGESHIEQGSRNCELHPGDFAIQNQGSPFRMAFSDDVATMFMLLNPVALGINSTELADIEATRIAHDDGLAAVVSPLLTSMSRHVELITGLEGVRLVGGAVDLVATVLHTMFGTGRSDDDAVMRRRKLVEQIYSYIDENLGNPNLGPAQIAAASYISVRYLHGIFSQESMSVSSWIRERRLERCRRDLADPLLLRRPVFEIASRWGVPDASHFSRMFKTRFGISPTEYRLTPGVVGPLPRSQDRN